MIKGFSKGFLAYGDALRLIHQHGLWFYVIVPGIISLLLGIGIFSLGWGLSDDIRDWLLALYPWEWGKSAVAAAVQVLGGLAIVAVGLLIFKHLVMAITSPIMSVLSEIIETKIRGFKRPVPFTLSRAAKDLVRGLRIALRNIIRELFYTLLLLLLGLLLPFLSPAIPVAIFAVQAFYAGFGNIDFMLERHRDVKGSVQFARSHRGLCLGNGTAFLLLLFTGLGFLFALPLGTVAAAKETVPFIPLRQTGSQ